MKIIINPLENNSEMKRLKISNKFVISSKGKKANEISITPPKICPICGKKDVDSEFKIKSYGRKYMIVLLCREHKDLAKKAQKPTLIVLSLILFILVILFIPILFLLTNAIITLIIFGIVFPFFIFNSIRESFNLIKLLFSSL